MAKDQAKPPDEPGHMNKQMACKAAAVTGRKRQRVAHEWKVPKAAAHEGKGQQRKRLDLSPVGDPSDRNDELMGSDADYDEEAAENSAEASDDHSNDSGEQGDREAQPKGGKAQAGAKRKQPEPASATLKYDYSGKDTKHSKCDPREDWEQVLFEYCPRKRGRRPMIEMVPGSGEYFQATVDGLSETEIHVHFPEVPDRKYPAQDVWLSRKSSRLWRGRLEAKYWSQVKGVVGAWKPKSVKGGKKRPALQQQDRGREEGKLQPAATQEHDADSSPERAGTRAAAAGAGRDSARSNSGQAGAGRDSARGNLGQAGAGRDSARGNSGQANDGAASKGHSAAGRAGQSRVKQERVSQPAPDSSDAGSMEPPSPAKQEADTKPEPEGQLVHSEVQYIDIPTLRPPLRLADLFAVELALFVLQPQHGEAASRPEAQDATHADDATSGHHCVPPRMAAVKSRSEQGSGEAGPQRCTSLEQATSAAPAPPAAQVLVQQRGLVRGDSAMDHVLGGSRRKQDRSEPAQSCERVAPAEPAPPADLASGNDAAEAAHGTRRRREPALREVMGLNCYYVEEKRRHEAQSNSDSRGGLRAQSVGVTAVEIDKGSGKEGKAADRADRRAQSVPESSSRAVSKGTAGKGQPVTSSSGKVGAAVKQNGDHSGAQPRKGSLGKGLEHSARPAGKQAGAGRLLPHGQLDKGATETESGQSSDTTSSPNLVAKREGSSACVAAPSAHPANGPVSQKLSRLGKVKGGPGLTGVGAKASHVKSAVASKAGSGINGSVPSKGAAGSHKSSFGVNRAFHATHAGRASLVPSDL